MYVLVSFFVYHPREARDSVFSLDVIPDSVTPCSTAWLSIHRYKKKQNLSHRSHRAVIEERQLVVSFIDLTPPELT